MVQSQGLVTRANVYLYWISSSLADSFGSWWCGSAGGAVGEAEEWLGEPSLRGLCRVQGVPDLEAVARRGFGLEVTWEELVNPFASLPQVWLDSGCCC